MKVDLSGRVENLDLPKTKPLLPLLEAVSNSIHAIEDAGILDGRITIRILRDIEGSLSLDEDAKGLVDIVGFEIIDNGTGFDDDNFGSFETCDSRFKASRGAKGIGRLLWLKAFTEIRIISNYLTFDGKARLREFEFALPQGVTEPRDRPRQGNIRQTTVHLGGFRPEYAGQCPKKASTIADRLINHLVLNFLNPKAPQVELVDGLEAEPINLNSRFHEYFSDYGEEESFELGGHAFTLHHLRILTPEPSPHRIHLCAGFREVRDFQLRKFYGGLSSKLIDADGHAFSYLGLITGPLLDERVNQNRTDFDLARIEELRIEEEPTLEEIREVAIARSISKLEPFLKSIREQIVREVRNVIQEEYPEFRPLLPEVEKQIDSFSPNASKLDIIKKVNEIQLLSEIETREEGETLGKVPVSESEEYRARYRTYLAKVTKAAETRLAQYVTHRKSILDVLEERLKLRDNDKYPLEEEVHELIFPLKTTSDDPGAWGHQNLWLVDERLAYHFWLASDKPLKAQDTVDSESGERPDLLIMNRPGAFSSNADGHEKLSSVIIVELKRPGRSNKGSDKKNPIEQMLDYISDIQTNTVKDKEGRPIHVGDNTAFYAYLVCDIIKGSDYDKMINNHGLLPTPDGMGYFTYNPALKAYIEIITFDKLVRDARQRNLVLFKNLGIEHRLRHSEIESGHKAEDIANLSPSNQ
ncbi:MAG: hypothetical protein EAZ81_04135 [Verrucomicrobia bacterium]|nr:MAG: hypothetical protein EAZ81_04135 [Verrucomicrobiota bacterium]